MRGALRAVGAVVAVGIGALVLACGAIRLINAHDEPPSADVRALDAILDKRPAVADADNGFVYLLALAVPEGEDVWQRAVERKHVLEAVTVAQSNGFAGQQAADPYVGDRDYRGARTPAVKAFAAACANDYRDCAKALDDDAVATAAQWLAAEGWLLQRYKILVALPQWQEAVPWGPSAPLAPYPHAMEGQRLLLTQAWLQARNGNAGDAIDLLDRDLRFWRGVLAGSNTLIGKTIATAAVNRNFVMGNLILRALPQGIRAEIPAQWRLPLRTEERSMGLALAGEWRLYQAGLDASQFFRKGVGSSEDDLVDVLMNLLFQPQATRNLMAGRLLRQIEASHAPYLEVKLAFAKAIQTPPPSHWYEYVYNPLGRLQMSSPAGYDQYALRVADLEGLRRVTLQTALLRGQGVPATAVAEALKAPDAQRDPYTDQPLAWDAAAGEIRFSACAPLPGRYTLPY